MTSNRFFISQLKADSPFIILKGEEYHHLGSVVRVKPGEVVWLFDSQGRNFRARVEEVGREKTRLRIIEELGRDEARVRIILGQALIKTKKMDFLIQKSAELGVSGLIPVIAERSVVKMEGRGEKRLERWRRIAREAVKQSKNPWIPRLFPPLPVERLVKEVEAEKKYFLYENRGTYLRDILLQGSLSSEDEPPRSVLILVGPEGGWTPREVKLILGHGFEEVSLGKNILRSETAALCSVALISHFWNF